jgi:hypothetical protein
LNASSIRHRKPTESLADLPPDATLILSTKGLVAPAITQRLDNLVIHNRALHQRRRVRERDSLSRTREASKRDAKKAKATAVIHRGGLFYELIISQLPTAELKFVRVVVALKSD